MASMRPLAISCGEPAGIGPEIAVLAWEATRGETPLIWIGDPRHLPKGTKITEVLTAAEAIGAPNLPVLVQDMGSDRTPGVPNPNHAKGVIAAIETGVSLAINGDVSGLVTAPIHKAALIDGAGFAYPGHTEFLSALSGNTPVAMMLACEALKVVPATIHIPLSEVPSALTADLLTEVLTTTRDGLQRDFGITNPRIAVAGLNPHAGEDGKMGKEEIELITPVLDTLRALAFNLSGPLSADTMFHPQARAGYDAAVCMYHDQALIPIKTLDFSGGVNVTLGLPFVRTSPDHGTAFDIAGTGKADATSMITAVRMAAQMATARGLT